MMGLVIESIDREFSRSHHNNYGYNNLNIFSNKTLSVMEFFPFRKQNIIKPIQLMSEDIDEK